MTKSILSTALIIGAAGILAAGISSNAREAEPILIGMQAPITGQYANERQGIASGTKMIVEQVNKQGGLLGRKLGVKVEDLLRAVVRSDVAFVNEAATHLVKAGGKPYPDFVDRCGRAAAARRGAGPRTVQPSPSAWAYSEPSAVTACARRRAG